MYASLFRTALIVYIVSCVLKGAEILSLDQSLQAIGGKLNCYFSIVDSVSSSRAKGSTLRRKIPVTHTDIQGISDTEKAMAVLNTALPDMRFSFSTASGVAVIRGTHKDLAEERIQGRRLENFSFRGSISGLFSTALQEAGQNIFPHHIGPIDPIQSAFLAQQNSTTVHIESYSGTMIELVEGLYQRGNGMLVLNRIVVMCYIPEGNKQWHVIPTMLFDGYPAPPPPPKRMGTP